MLEAPGCSETLGKLFAGGEKKRNFGGRCDSRAAMSPVRGPVRFTIMSRLGLVGSLLLSTTSLVFACGGRSELDDYANGLPSVVPVGDLSGNGDGDGDDDDDDDDGDGDGDRDDDGDGDGDDMSTGAEVGAACDEKSDCMGGAKAECIKNVMVDLTIIQLPIEFPGGSCTITGCQGEGDCPEGTGCLTGFAAPACTVLCSEDLQCRSAEGYTCGALPFGSDTRKFCQPPVDLPF